MALNAKKIEAQTTTAAKGKFGWAWLAFKTCTEFGKKRGDDQFFFFISELLPITINMRDGSRGADERGQINSVEEAHAGKQTQEKAPETDADATMP